MCGVQPPKTSPSLRQFGYSPLPSSKYSQPKTSRCTGNRLHAMSQNSNLTVTERMSLKQLIIKQNAELQQVVNPKTGKAFFVCGKDWRPKMRAENKDLAGYISPAAQQKLEDPASTVEDFQFAMVAKPGEEAIPCLMVVGNSQANVKRVLGSNLLH